MNKTILITIALIVLAGFLFWGFQTGFFATLFSGPVTPSQLPSGIVLFFAEDCPHCKIVEAFIVDNKIEGRVKLTRLEVPFYTKTSPQLEANGKLAIQVAQSCKMDVSNGVSIPLLYDGSSKCFLGDVDTINFLKAQAGIQ